MFPMVLKSAELIKYFLKIGAQESQDKEISHSYYRFKNYHPIIMVTTICLVENKFSLLYFRVLKFRNIIILSCVIIILVHIFE